MARKTTGPHSYLVLKEKLALPCGSLVELRDGSYYEHSHFWYVEVGEVSFNPGDLAPLTKEECVLLDAIQYPVDDRYAVYSTPGKLAWGVGLKVGDAVMARLPGHQNGDNANGVVRSIGVHDHELFGQISLFGIEIMVS